MAVPKRKTSKSARNQRRSHHALKVKHHIGYDQESGGVKLMHHVSEDGFFNGTKLKIFKSLKTRMDQNAENQDEELQNA